MGRPFAARFTNGPRLEICPGNLQATPAPLRASTLPQYVMQEISVRDNEAGRSVPEARTRAVCYEVKNDAKANVSQPPRARVFERRLVVYNRVWPVYNQAWPDFARISPALAGL